MTHSQIPTKGVITGTAEIFIDSDKDFVFKYITAEDVLPKILKKYGPVHAVEKVVINKGPWSVAGAYRTLYFDSGDTLREELLTFKPSEYFDYSISEFSNFAKHLSEIAYGQFWFTTRGNQTAVRWTYTFKPKNMLTKAVLSLFMDVYFKKYMQQCLQIVKSNIENYS